MCSKLYCNTCEHGVINDNQGKAKLLWNGYAYTKHIEKNGMIWWRCTCRASKHCPASAYTNLLPNCLLITKMSYHQNVCYQEVLLPKCLLPKSPITEMSSYRNVCYQNVHLHTTTYTTHWPIFRTDRQL